MMRGSALLALLFLFSLAGAQEQQATDPSFKPGVAHPQYRDNRGPVVMIDDAHGNIHTDSGGYAPFAEVLRADGHRVVPFTTPITVRALKGGRVLVIANALSKRTAHDWNAPPESAFTDEEIATLRGWIREGGALLLVADHMPAPGSIDRLATAFGVRWSNGYAQDPRSGGLMQFTRSEGSLADHSITRGRSESERIDSVMTFAGSAFQSGEARPLLTFTAEAVSWIPEDARRLVAGSPSIGVKGWQQGAVLQYGKGRVAFFGEAAMFTAQTVEQGGRMGMSNPRALQNEQFLLNVMHWLTGVLD